MRYDVAVVGGGPGGYTAAICAAQKGLSVILIERREAGGTCLNRGCIPTKALLHCSGEYRAAQNAARFGVCLSVQEPDFSAMAAHKDAVTAKLRRGVEQLLKANGAEFLQAEAVLAGPHSLKANGRTVEFSHLILATGSRPAPPPFPVEKEAPVIDSDGFLALKAPPEQTIIVGGGVIGIEFATILAGLGKKVIVCEAMPQILPGMDADLAAFVQKKLEQQGVQFCLSTFVTRAVGETGRVVCTLKSGDAETDIAADLAVCAIGRRADSSSVKPENAGIITERGRIPVDDFCRTNVPHIYAVGDVNGRVMLAHAASAQAKTVAASIAEKKNRACDFSLVPACVYTDPEIACIGLTEKQAEKEGKTVKTGIFDAAGNGKLMTAGRNEGFCKIVSDAQTGEILGAQLCMDRATDLISEITLAMKLEATVTELAQTIHPHPTVSEMLMEAADDCLSQSVHKIYR